jgi:transcription initiation factor IIF auxiliary subunit
MDEFKIGQWEKYEGDDWWQWAVWVEASDQALEQIEHVEWTLHPTFPDPVRRATNRAQKFRLETGGWGVFPIIARLKMKSGDTVRLRYTLQLHYPDGRKTSA